MDIRLVDLTRSEQENKEIAYALSDKKVITIGRHVKGYFINDIKIPNVLRLQRNVSKKQSILYVEEEGLYVEDNGSKHGTFVDGEKLDVGEKKLIKNGSVIGLSPYYELRVKIIKDEDVELKEITDEDLGLEDKLKGGSSAELKIEEE